MTFKPRGKRIPPIRACNVGSFSCGVRRRATSLISFFTRFRPRGERHSPIHSGNHRSCRASSTSRYLSSSECTEVTLFPNTAAPRRANPPTRT
ncbi:hypothetical protein M413DRAFT_133853 [Hebeloma cylindrosporum]|uniref:Uncharacterized protein n=1 Tax=Hebeloma cylindrosporum TaxID=76867 RepID=A0A0C3CFM7_HEBCY|nr:hypothetical protein M413DRAFT_133853 [Hebeloma cylindrosporum h7]